VVVVVVLAAVLPEVLAVTAWSGFTGN